MIKKLFLLAFVTVLFTACNNNATTDVEGTDEGTEKVYSVAELNDQIDSLVGQEVIVEGIVDHVCKHGGGKMVIFSTNPKSKIHILATDESGDFRGDEVMGELVKVVGIVDEFRIDEGFIIEKEAKLAEMIAANPEGLEEVAEEVAEEATEEHGDDGEKGEFPDKDDKHKKEISGLKKQIEKYKESLAKEKENGKDHISFYSVKCSTYEVIPTEGENEKLENGEGYIENAAEGAAEEEVKNTEGEEHSEEEAH